MTIILKRMSVWALAVFFCAVSFGQRSEAVKLVRDDANKKVDIYIGGQLFTSFLYPDTLEKPCSIPLLRPTGLS